MADFVFPEDGGTGATDGDFNDAANFASLAQATGLKNYVVQGLNFTLNAGTPSLDISEGKAVVTADSATANQSTETRDGVAFVADMDARTGIALTDADVNHVFLQVDLSTDDTINIIVNTTNSAPSQPYVKLGTVDTSADTTTELNREIPLTLGELESLDAGSRNISNLSAPVNPNDATRKAYVDAIEQGLNLKDAVRAATDGSNIDLTSATDPNPVDGVTLSDGDRVLLKDQTDGTENGIYVATTATDPTTWSRSEDFDNDADVTSGSFTFVEEGTVNANAGFVVTTNDPITVGTTSISFTQFSGAGQITAGEGLTKTGDTLDVRLDIDDDGGNVTPAYGINFGGNYFDVADDGDNTVSVSLTNDSVMVNGGDGLKNGGSVALGGSITLDVEPADFAGTGLQDDGADNLQLVNTAVTVAGNTVSLGGSTAVDHIDLSNISSDDHHVRPSAGTHLIEDGSNNFNVDESGIDVENLGSQGASGTVPVSQGDGSLSMQEISGGLERIADLDGLVPYKQSFNTVRNRKDWIDYIFQNNESMADEITSSQVLTHYVFEAENDAYDRFIDPNHNLGLFAYNNDSEPVISSVYEGAMFLAPTSFLEGLMTIESVADQVTSSQTLMDAVHNGDAVMENNFGFAGENA